MPLKEKPKNPLPCGGAGEEVGGEGHILRTND
jgi:hypothetical protein